ncbi:hypothetical protein F5X96DRAFT_684574 [Biscogniauxia mediterranea]|nr:hypothetical protein F5X96DRAFT_684574 [Biscogniauxia mediterranea]
MASPALGAIPETITNPDSVQAWTKNSKLPFFQLSVEVRTMIYEYVVSCAYPIQPRQVTEKSNKFVWRHSNLELIDKDNIGSRSLIRVPKGEPLMVTQLMKTCQHMYWDLTMHPVFYRVNKFVFESSKIAHKFLAALTPERRKMIRQITFNQGNGSVADSGTILRQTPADRHLIVLLQDCTDLRSIEMVLKARNDMALRLLVSSIIKNATSPDMMSSPLWKLPVAFRIWYGGIPDVLILLDGNKQSQPPKWADTLNIGGEIISLVNEANHVIAAHNSPLAAEWERLRREQVDTSPSKKELHKAIGAAGIDFPGESRIHQVRSIGLNDTVSRRTRAQVKAENNVTPWGTIKKNMPKYNSEGILLWEYLPRICGLRWNGLLIEVEVEWPTASDLADGPTSWEEIHHLGNWVGLHRIRTFFSRMTKKITEGPEFIEQIEKMPTPQDVEDALEGLLHGDIPKGRLSEWIHLKEHYERDIGFLKKHILERAEAREKMKAEKLEKLKAKKVARAEARAAKEAARAEARAAKAEIKAAKEQEKLAKAQERAAKAQEKPTAQKASKAQTKAPTNTSKSSKVSEKGIGKSQ